jgi:hypothetical protein
MRFACVKSEGGGFVLELSGEEQLKELHDGELNGVCVLEEGQVEGGSDAYACGDGGGGIGEGETLLLPSFVKEAQFFVA